MIAVLFPEIWCKLWINSLVMSQWTVCVSFHFESLDSVLALRVTTLVFFYLSVFQHVTQPLEFVVISASYWGTFLHFSVSLDLYHMPLDASISLSSEQVFFFPTEIVFVSVAGVFCSLTDLTRLYYRARWRAVLLNTFDRCRLEWSVQNSKRVEGLENSKHYSVWTMWPWETANDLSFPNHNGGC